MISNEDRELIRKFDSIRQKGYYCNSKQLQSVYNRVFNVSMTPTSCSSCMRQRIQKLVNALNKEEEEERKQASMLATNEETTTENERGEKGETESVPLESIKKKKGRPKKEKEE